MERIGYTEAARRSRLSRQRLMASDLAGQARAWKVWAVCNELTAGYSKSADRVNVSAIATLAELRPDKVSPLLRRFDELGIFIWRKDAHSWRKGFLALPSWVEPEAKVERRVETPPPADPTFPCSLGCGRTVTGYSRPCGECA